AKARAELGSGAFAQGMARTYFQKREQEAEVAAAIVANTAEIYRLNRPQAHRYHLRRWNHPLRVQERQDALARRREPAEREKTAAEFLELLVLDRPGMVRNGLQGRREYQAVGALREAGRPMEALEAWRDAFFAKLRNPAEYGVSGEYLDPFNGWINPRDR